MKKQLALLLLVYAFFSVPLPGQDYIPFPQDSAVWSVLRAGYDPFSGDFQQTTIRYFLAGDTLLDGQAYAGVYQTMDSGPLDPANADFIGGLREEDRVVYFGYGPFAEEVLYDFNLQVGDTLRAAFEECVVIAIDTSVVQLENQEERKVLEFGLVILNGNTNDTIPKVQWIEGVGSTVGFFGWRDELWEPCLISDPPPPDFTLLCFEKGGELLYTNPDYTDCYLSTGSEEAIPAVKVSLYPNPFSDELRLDWPDHLQVHTIDLLNGDGRVIRRWEGATDGKTLRLSAIPMGGYFLRLYSENGLLIRRVLKTR